MEGGDGLACAKVDEAHGHRHAHALDAFAGHRRSVGDGARQHRVSLEDAQTLGQAAAEQIFRGDDLAHALGGLSGDDFVAHALQL